MVSKLPSLMLPLLYTSMSANSGMYLQSGSSKAAAAAQEPPTAAGALVSDLLARGEHEAQMQAAASAAESDLQRQNSLKQEWQSVVKASGATSGAAPPEGFGVVITGVITSTSAHDYVLKE